MYLTFKYLSLLIKRIVNSRQTLLSNKIMGSFSRVLKINAASFVTLKNRKIMILDDFRIYHWLQININLLEQMRKYNNADIFVQLFDYPSPKTIEFYAGWGIKNFHIVYPRIRDLKRIYVHSRNISIDSATGTDVMNYQIDNCQIGIDIYESILRRGFSTLESRSWVQKRIIVIGVIQYFATKNLFDHNAIKVAAMSHDNYIGPGIVSRVAYCNEVVVMLANPLDVTFTTRSFQNYEKFKNYRKYASSVLPIDYENGIALSKNELDSRLNGELDKNMTYQRESAFSNKVKRQLGWNDSAKILIATHDFFDSPHGYGPMKYCDFMEWMETIAQYVDNCSHEIEWYLKCHPDASPEQLEIIASFGVRHPKFKVIDSKTSWQQLRDEGLGLVITCYGSVAHELPLLNIEVVNCSFNPHVAYDFSISLDSKIDLINYLDNFTRSLGLGASSIIDRNQIYEFYFIHNYLTQIDDLFLKSYREFAQEFSVNWNSEGAVAEIENQAKLIEEKAARIISELRLKSYVRFFETKLNDYNFELLHEKNLDQLFN